MGRALSRDRRERAPRGRRLPGNRRQRELSGETLALSSAAFRRVGVPPAILPESLIVRSPISMPFHRRLTPGVLVVEELKWIPQSCISEPDRQVGLRTGYEETAVHARIGRVQARLDPTAKLWRMTLGQATQLGPEERIATWGPARVNIPGDG